MGVLMTTDRWRSPLGRLNLVFPVIIVIVVELVLSLIDS